MQYRIPYAKCKAMTLKQIRNTEEYKKLPPLPGQKANKSGTYKFGFKSSANKEELCKIMDNPVRYQKKVLRNKQLKQNSSKRKRSTRKGECLYPLSRVPKRGACVSGDFPYLGLTTTSKKCCYKRPQSKKTIAKRMGKR
jgi:hypothetical protein